MTPNPGASCLVKISVVVLSIGTAGHLLMSLSISSVEAFALESANTSANPIRILECKSRCKLRWKERVNALTTLEEGYIYSFIS